MTECVRLSPQEIIFGKKILLESQLNILNSMKRLKEYRRLRAEELVLKIQLKQKVEEAKNELYLLDKALPKPTFSKEKEDNLFPIVKAKPREASLEEELDLIRKKLAGLQ